MIEYIRQPLTRTELIIGSILTLLNIGFMSTLFHVRGWDESTAYYISVFFFVILSGFGVVVGAVAFTHRIKQSKNVVMKIIWIVLFVPFIYYVGWVFFIAKVYHNLKV